MTCRATVGAAPYDSVVRFLGLDLLELTALAALAGFLLAAVTVAAVLETVRLAQSEREHDDRQRKEDRDRDDQRRREDREHDAELRRRDIERADQLRREDDEKWERRYRAEQRSREDYEARQVTVQVVKSKPPFEAMGHDLNHQLIISTPAELPIGHVDAMIAHNSNGTLR